MEYKPFDLQAAKAGAPVQTANGTQVKIVSFDIEGEYPILALTDAGNGRYTFDIYTESGRVDRDSECKDDLVMTPTKQTRWINVYKQGSIRLFGTFCGTEEEAVRAIDHDRHYVTTIKVEWEE